MEENTKRQLIQCGIFTGIIFGFFAVLTGFVFLSRANWNKGLKVAIYEVLKMNDMESYSFGKPVNINNNMSVSAACFEMKDESEKSCGYVMIMRMTTYYGPLPAVFYYEKETETVKFLGIYGMKSSVRKYVNNNENDRIIRHWSEKCRLIFSEIEKRSGGNR